MSIAPCPDIEINGKYYPARRNEKGICVPDFELNPQDPVYTGQFPPYGPYAPPGDPRGGFPGTADPNTNQDPLNPFGPNFGGQESDAVSARDMDAPPGGPPPGLEPLEKPPVPPFPSDKEQEDISDANTRQDMIQDMREGNLNPYTLTDAQLEFFTKGTGTL